jgi:hypothetical protein
MTISANLGSDAEKRRGRKGVYSRYQCMSTNAYSMTLNCNKSFEKRGKKWRNFVCAQHDMLIEQYISSRWDNHLYKWVRQSIDFIAVLTWLASAASCSSLLSPRNCMIRQVGMHNQTLHASRFIDEYHLFPFDGQVEVEMSFHVTMLRYMGKSSIQINAFLDSIVDAIRQLWWLRKPWIQW